MGSSTTRIISPLLNGIALIICIVSLSIDTLSFFTYESLGIDIKYGYGYNKTWVTDENGMDNFPYDCKTDHDSPLCSSGAVWMVIAMLATFSIALAFISSLIAKGNAVKNVSILFNIIGSILAFIASVVWLGGSGHSSLKDLTEDLRIGFSVMMMATVIVESLMAGLFTYVWKAEIEWESKYVN